MGSLATLLIGGFGLGLLGSMHCVAMCGPIALALPFGKLQTSRQYFLTSLYTIGRVSAYAGLGVLFSLVGAQFFRSGMQQLLTLGVGLILILHLCYKYFKKKDSTFDTIIKRWTSFATKPMAKFLRSHNPFTVLAAGFLNGLLPCGLVYLACASSIVLSSIGQGALFMVAFGIGTAPALFAVLILSKKFNLGFKIKKLVPILTLAVACLFVLRGLELGIPYLSPDFDLATSGEGCGTGFNFIAE